MAEARVQRGDKQWPGTVLKPNTPTARRPRKSRKNSAMRTVGRSWRPKDGLVLFTTFPTPSPPFTLTHGPFFPTLSILPLLPGGRPIFPPPPLTAVPPIRLKQEQTGLFSNAPVDPTDARSSARAGRPRPGQRFLHHLPRSRYSLLIPRLPLQHHPATPFPISRLPHHPISSRGSPYSPSLGRQRRPPIPLNLTVISPMNREGEWI